MKKKNTVIALMIIMCLCLLTGCDSASDDKYCIPSYIVEMQGITSQQYVDMMKQQGKYEGMYEDFYADKKGNIVFELNEKQRKEMLLRAQDDFAALCVNIQQSGYNISYNESYTQLKLSCLEEEFEQETVFYLAYLMSVCQAYNNVVLEDNYVEVQVCDLETQEMLYEEEFSAGKGKPKTKDVVHTVESNTTGCIFSESVIEASSGENVYAISSLIPYMEHYKHRYQNAYYDEEGSFVMELSDDQCKYWLEQSKSVLNIFNDINSMLGFSFATSIEYDAFSYECGIVYCSKEEFGTSITQEDIKGLALSLSNCQTFMGDSIEDNNVVLEVSDGKNVFYQVIIEKGVLK